MDDVLLRKFAATKDPEAFASLMAQHLDWVYGAALRQVGDRHLAEDIAQAVFMLLSRKAAGMRRGTRLTGWLFRAVRYAAMNARTMRRRRLRHEQLAAGGERDVRSQDWWERVGPALDDAVAKLARADRELVLARFYENRTYEEIAQGSGVSADGVRKRTSRAVAQMREFLRSRAGELPEEFDGLLASKMASVAPAGLAQAIAASLAGSGVSGTVTVLAAKAANGFWLAKAKAMAAVVAGIAIVGGVGAAVTSRSAVVAVRPATAPTPVLDATAVPDIPKVAQSTAPTTVKAYLELALQDAARISNGNDQMATYQQFIIDLSATGDIAAAQQILPRIAKGGERDAMKAQIEVSTAVALAKQGNVADARALNERIAVESMRQHGEGLIALAEVVDLVKKGKPEEALQMAQDQEKPRASVTALCALVREFALAKDAPRTKKALDLAIKATSYLDPDDRRNACSDIAQAEAIAGDVQGARARVSAIENPRSRDVAYHLIARAEAQTGDAEGANQTMASVGQSGGERVFGYSDCAMMSLERGDEANAQRFLKQAIAAYSADPDTEMRPWTVYGIVGVQVRLGHTAAAMALARQVNDDPRARAAAYGHVAFYQTLREGPAAAYAWAHELPSPVERAYAWAAIAHGIVERQKRAGTQAGQ